MSCAISISLLYCDFQFFSIISFNIKHFCITLFTILFYVRGKQFLLKVKYLSSAFEYNEKNYFFFLLLSIKKAFLKQVHFSENFDILVLQLII